jgi:hypothetical protein
MMTLPLSTWRQLLLFFLPRWHWIARFKTTTPHKWLWNGAQRFYDRVLWLLWEYFLCVYIAPLLSILPPKRGSRWAFFSYLCIHSWWHLQESLQYLDQEQWQRMTNHPMATCVNNSVCLPCWTVLWTKLVSYRCTFIQQRMFWLRSTLTSVFQEHSSVSLDWWVRVVSFHKKKNSSQGCDRQILRVILLDL